jgi:hypothetical protein
MGYVELRFNLKQQPEDQQRPLPEDLILIENNIKDLKKQTDEQKQSIKLKFDNLRFLQVELGTNKMKMN